MCEEMKFYFFLLSSLLAPHGDVVGPHAESEARLAKVGLGQVQGQHALVVVLGQSGGGALGLHEDARYSHVALSGRHVEGSVAGYN